MSDIAISKQSPPSQANMAVISYFPIFIQVVCLAAIGLVTFGFYFRQQYRYPVERPLLHVIWRNDCEFEQPASWSQWRRVTVVRPPIAANCTRLWKGDVSERYYVKAKLAGWKPAISDNDFMKWLLSAECWLLRLETGEFYVSAIEKEYPLAFTVVVSQKATTMKQYFRHLKAIYRPHNIYCYHIDLKSSQLFFQTFRHIASCFDNIILPHSRISVRYGSIDHVTSQMLCHLALMNLSSVPWKHVINLAGTEVPLRTNREIVNSLRPLEGYPVIQMPIRLKYSDVHVSGWIDFLQLALWLKIDNPIPELQNVTLWKSITYSALTKEFIAFLTTDKEALKLWNHLRTAAAPEELLYATVNQWPTSPGNAHQLSLLGRAVPMLVNVFWREKGIFVPDGACIDQYAIHRVCIVSISDLPLLAPMSAFFFNKYLDHYDHVVMDCIEEHLIRTNLIEYETDCARR